MDYSEYTFSKKEILFGAMEYLTICAVVAIFFYRSIWAFIILLPGIYGYFGIYRQRLIVKRKRRLTVEFSQTLYSVISGLRAGYSIENAFIEAGRDLLMFYGDKSLMALEIKNIKAGLSVSKSLEELIENLGNRSRDQDILLFSDVFKCAKRNGGNITEVLSKTADKIQERICIDEEINLLISEKRLELRIMEVIPFLILIYLDITSRGYFDILYGNLTGILIMTGCLVVYVTAILTAEKIVSIKI